MEKGEGEKRKNNKYIRDEKLEQRRQKKVKIENRRIGSRSPDMRLTSEDLNPILHPPTYPPSERGSVVG